MSGQVATAQIEINAPASDVWTALTDPKLIKEYMFGSDVSTSWKPGTPITWSGEFNGKPYEDKGEVIEVDPPRVLRMTHENHNLGYQLTEHDGFDPGRSHAGRQRRRGRRRGGREELVNDAGRTQNHRREVMP